MGAGAAGASEQRLRVRRRCEVFEMHMVIGAPGAYKVDWWSPEPDEDWEPVERGEFDDVEEPDEVSHLA
jgi:hypothetical protein